MTALHDGAAAWTQQHGLKGAEHWKMHDRAVQGAAGLHTSPAGSSKMPLPQWLPAMGGSPISVRDDTHIHIG